ncbi:MAG: beta-N-acetylhexosaminidase, partial [Clostridia bacterium]|nr:beta-N-acetylhexosaminidase [Clostridia bacterium]
MSYQTLGVMLDMSRNAVMRPDALKQYLTHLAKMGYNCVMLYTEDTYEVEGEPYFGYLRGRYTADELRDLDAFAASLGMELIPCIQTLAHLQGFVPWRQVPV